MALKTTNLNNIGSKFLPWDEIEKALGREVKWLENTIINSPFKRTECPKCIFRQIAILIVSGKVRAQDIKSSIGLWGSDYSFPLKQHGKEWHTNMMKLVAGYFKSLNYGIALEPNLAFGRADLGVYKKSERNLFVEVGTVSISKLLYNLEVMVDSDILIVLDKNHTVKFSILEVATNLETIKQKSNRESH